MIKHYSCRIQNVIQSELFKAQHSIKVCVAWLTNDLLFQPLLLKLKTGVEIYIILNKDDVNLRSKVNFEQFTQLGGRLLWNTSKKLLHNKFCIIDGRIVISGSYNWTIKAEYNHEDVTVYTEEENTISHYEKLFDRLLQECSKSNNIKNTNTKQMGKDEKNKSDAYSVIEYTSLDGKIVEPQSDASFDGEIVSNIYDKRKNKGIIKFDRVITIIGDKAFLRCTNLTSIIIPDGVKIIGAWVFANCDQLINVTIPKSVTKIREVAFCNCTSLSDIILPENITNIGYWAFSGCTNLTNMTIPNSVIEIEDAPFEYCESLTQFKGKYASGDGRCLIVDGTLKGFAPYGINEYVIPEGVNIIGLGAFCGCEKLSSITIANTVTNIGQSAFVNCKSLTSVVIPSGVTEIEKHAFLECYNLSTIIIPNSVDKLALSAFATYPLEENDKLINIYINNDIPPTINQDNLLTNEELNYCRFLVPIKSVSIYKNATGWKEYADQILGFSF